MSQLEHEAEELRKRLNTNNNKVDSPIGVLNGIPDLSHTPQSLGSSSTIGTSPSQTLDPLSVQQSQSLLINARPAPVVVQATTSPAHSDGPTQMRTVKGVRIDANEIDDIFQLCVSTGLVAEYEDGHTDVDVIDSSKITPLFYQS